MRFNSASCMLTDCETQGVNALLHWMCELDLTVISFFLNSFFLQNIVTVFKVVGFNLMCENPRDRQ